jgi:predicted permease
VEAASLSQEVPLGYGRWDTRIQVPGLAPPEGLDGHRVEYRMVTPDYFRTMGIPLLRGQGLTGGDTGAASWQVIINRTGAERFWPGEEALGKTIGWTTRDGVTVDAVVVGVAEDSAYSNLFVAPHPHLYVPYSKVFNRDMVLHVRAADPTALIPSVRERIAAIDSNLPILGVRTMEEQFAASIGQHRMAAQVSTTAAVLALVLAVLGLYGAVSWYVRQRTREIGVRMALGATAGGVVAMVVRQGMVLVAIGVALGLAGSLAVTRLLSSMFFEVGTGDPMTLIVTVGMLAATGGAAAWLPARRATRVDPVTTLRHE